MKRLLYIPLVMALLLLPSCATSKKVEAIPLSITESPADHLFRLSVNQAMLQEAGYTLGDIVTIELEGMLIHARYSLEAKEGYTTLVATEAYSLLHLPKELKEGSTGMLFPYRDERSKINTKLNVTGNFVFTL
ncbi:hypothetical protein [Sphaerochaeta halotolerans]|jgi:hypothetical protein|uniref:hypothetical protein n=1 Tax=Sphaerochaeta halotolerans TaxID=2293840 RepID=UPI001370F237|nr:hypothetical protein [Sphaerochaeta halotolerans]MXI87086.1 hypothetical protein [Sphaerochaeta halotolerans]